ANAFAILGASEVLTMDPGHVSARKAMTRWSGRLHVSDSPGWPWPEKRLAYDNARIPEALIAAGAGLGDDHLIDAGLRLLDWLVTTETRDGHFSFTPVGGWAPGEPRPGYDQQPVEAAAMADACSRAFLLTGDGKWRDEVLRAARWLLEDNDGQVVLYDFETGGCCDGLTTRGPNLNQGAESTLAALSTLQQARMMA
ncbi:MAG: glycosyltransferase, partial [Acidimicrobiia bacterium]